MRAYMWNLEKRCRRTYLQGRNRDAGLGNGLVDTVGKERVEQIGKVVPRLLTAKADPSGR